VSGGPLYARPVHITSEHKLAAFDCGNEAMNNWLREFALRNEGLVSRTYVVADAGGVVIAYYSLVGGVIERSELPKRLRQHMPKIVPVVLLGRLAVDRNHAGLGLGKALLREALRCALQQSELVASRGVLVEAIDEAALSFYKPFGFLPSPTGDRKLILPTETIQAAVS